jgi:uncharacterized protein DUF4157
MPLNFSKAESMLQAPITLGKERGEASRTLAVPQPEQELYPRFSDIAGVDRGPQSMNPLAAAQTRRHFAGLQRTIGNQAVLRMLNQPTLPRPTNLPTAGPALQRKCACGGSGGECDSCKAKREEGTLQRKVAGDVAGSEAPAIVHDVLRSSGQPLGSATRAFFEPRLGQDFSRVRTHSDFRAAQSARSVNAVAYTVGQHIVFDAGNYEPQTMTGQTLIAHELAHVAQQAAGTSSDVSLRVGRHDDPAEADADKVAASVMSGGRAFTGTAPPALRRKVVVNPPAAVGQMATLFDFLCPGTFSAAGSGITGACTVNTSASCECLCDVVNDAARTYTLQVGDAKKGTGPATLAGGVAATIPTTSLFPTTAGGPNPTIQMPSTASNVEFGEFSPTGSGMWAPNWRILGHELCGHARLNQSYAGSSGDRPGHDVTIDTENQIAAEHAGPARGHYADKRQGESFYNPVGDRSKVVYFQKDGEHYDAP